MVGQGLLRLGKKQVEICCDTIASCSAAQPTRKGIPNRQEMPKRRSDTASSLRVWRHGAIYSMPVSTSQTWWVQRSKEMALLICAYSRYARWRHHTCQCCANLKEPRKHWNLPFSPIHSLGATWSRTQSRFPHVTLFGLSCQFVAPPRGGYQKSL